MTRLLDRRVMMDEIRNYLEHVVRVHSSTSSKTSVQYYEKYLVANKLYQEAKQTLMQQLTDVLTNGTFSEMYIISFFDKKRQQQQTFKNNIPQILQETHKVLHNHSKYKTYKKGGQHQQNHGDDDDDMDVFEPLSKIRPKLHDFFAAMQQRPMGDSTDDQSMLQNVSRAYFDLCTRHREMVRQKDKEKWSSSLICLKSSYFSLLAAATTNKEYTMLHIPMFWYIDTIDTTDSSRQLHRVCGSKQEKHICCSCVELASILENGLMDVKQCQCHDGTVENPMGQYCVIFLNNDNNNKPKTSGSGFCSLSELQRSDRTEI